MDLFGETAGIDTSKNGNAREVSRELDLVDAAKKLEISQSLAEVEQVEEKPQAAEHATIH